MPRASKKRVSEKAEEAEEFEGEDENDEYLLSLQLNQSIMDFEAEEAPSHVENMKVKKLKSSSRKGVPSDTRTTDPSRLMTPASEATPVADVPVEIMAERWAKAGIWLHVRWEGFPEETDWTWEFENDFFETAPALVEAWKETKEWENDAMQIARKAEAEEKIKERIRKAEEAKEQSTKRTREAEEEVEEEPANPDDIVEKILSKRKVKGVPHYLVKWVGYEQVKDRTWEPCERLAVDVPSIVDAYEGKKTGKK